MDNSQSSESANTPVKQSGQKRRAGFVGYIKRKLQERKTKKEKETPADKAVRVTATSTVWMAVFTFVLALVGIATFIEIIKGGTDTHDLAVNTGKQADLMHDYLVSTQGAILRPSTELDSGGFGIGLSNVHDAAATDVNIKIQMTWKSWPGERPLAEPIIKEFHSPSVAKEKAFHVTVPVPWHIKIRQLGDEPWPGKRTVEFRVEYSYNNGFKEVTTETFCSASTPIITIATKTENANVGGLLPCDGLGLSIQGIQDKKKEAAH